jgi:hypothetical protein
MPSNREIYEQGVLDAEQDDLNPFYYQHYYYYRKGYDEARRRLRRAPAVARGLSLRTLVIAVLAIGLLAGGFFGMRLLNRNDLSAAMPTASAAAAPATSAPQPSATARPTARPTVTPTPEPQMETGARARVADLGGAPLRLRSEPGQGARLLARIPEGSEVTLLEGPIEADGYLWWRVQSEQGEGWCAGSTTDGATRFLEPIS